MEAGIKSGSLITARMAIDQGKEVFALLGNNSPQNEGSNTLIKNGLACPVTDFMDVLSEFNSNRGLYVEDETLDFDNISFTDLEAVPVKGKKTAKSKNSTNKKDKAKPERINTNVSSDKALKPEKAVKETKNVARKNSSVSADVNNKENADVRKSISDLKALGLSDAAVTVYGTIGNKPVHIDKIVSELGIPVFKVLTALTQLEMKGLVTAMQGRMYVLK